MNFEIKINWECGCSFCYFCGRSLVDSDADLAIGVHYDTKYL